MAMNQKRRPKRVIGSPQAVRNLNFLDGANGNSGNNSSPNLVASGSSPVELPMVSVSSDDVHKYHTANSPQMKHAGSKAASALSVANGGTYNGHGSSTLLPGTPKSAGTLSPRSPHTPGTPVTPGSPMGELNMDIECPICNTRMLNLNQLNRHIDDMHLDSGSGSALASEFENDSGTETSVGAVPPQALDTGVEDLITSWIRNKIKLPNNILSTNTTKQIDMKIEAKFRQKLLHNIDKRGWIKLTKSRTCSEDGCKAVVRPKPTEERVSYKNNCVSCGRIFCGRHLGCNIKMSMEGKVDSGNGVWSRCCYQCYKTKTKGYLDNENSSGYVQDLTQRYQEMRAVKIESTKLVKLKLLNRLESYINAMVHIYYQYHVNFSGLGDFFTFNDSKSKLMAEYTGYWHDADSCKECSICRDNFNQFFKRKHHCRLCGLVVCNNECSKELPLNLLVPIVRLKNPTQYSQVAEKMNETIRICLNCKSTLFKKKNFDKDVEKPQDLLSAIESLLMLKTQIDLLKVEENHNKIKQFTKLLTNFETESKRIIVKEPKTVNETQLIGSVKIFSVNYILSKTKTLKNIQKQMQISQMSNGGNSRNSLSTGGSSSNSSIIVDSSQKDTMTILKLDKLDTQKSAEEVRQLRENLMIFKEQEYLLEKTLDNARHERRFDEVSTLVENLGELRKEIEKVEQDLGEYSIS